MLAFIRLIRPLNLLLVVLCMYSMRYWVIGTLISQNGLELQLSNLNFFLLVLSAFCIAAAGNVINDYFDLKTDAINKPNKLIIGSQISPKAAIALHLVFNTIGISSAIYLSYSIGHLKFAAIHLFAATSLWFYSIYFKKHLLLSNLVVSLLAGLIPLLVAIYELPLLIDKYALHLDEIFLNSGYTSSFFFKVILFWVVAFAFFAFITNFIREVQKDLADIKGDQEAGRVTLPIRFGFKNVKIFVGILTLLWSVVLLYGQNYFLGDTFSLAYFVVLLVLPMIVSGILTLRANTPKQYSFASNITKIVMLLGVCFSYFIDKLL